MPAEQPRVVAQMLLALVLVAGLVGVEHSLQRRLGVDDDVLAAGQADDQVRAQRRLVARDRGLLGEIAVPDHARELDHVAQLHLPPLPARIRLAERGHERAGLGPQALAGLGKGPQLRLEPPSRLPPVLIECQQLGVDPAELLLERRDKLLDRLLAVVEVSPGLGPRRVQLGAIELGQLRDARLQGVVAHRLERRRQPLLGVGDRRQPLLSPRALVLEVSVGADQLALELAGTRRLVRQRAHPGPERDEHDAGAGEQTE